MRSDNINQQYEELSSKFSKDDQAVKGVSGLSQNKLKSKEISYL
jgi:hypothetical protein